MYIIKNNRQTDKMPKRKASQISVIPLWMLYLQVVIDHKKEEEKSNNTVGNLDPMTVKQNNRKTIPPKKVPPENSPPKKQIAKTNCRKICRRKILTRKLG